MSTPLQCPDCARFLSRTFVENLVDEDAPCPKCEELLTATVDGEEFTVHLASGAASEPTTADPVTTAPLQTGQRTDVLDGWDTDAPYTPAVLEPSAPLDPKQLAGAAGAGALVGMMVLRRKRVLGLILGGAAGAAGLLASRR